MPPTDRQLFQYLARALEPPAEEQLRRWLSSTTGAQERLESLAKATLPPSPVWSLPPPSLSAWGAHALRTSVAHAAVMDTLKGGWIEVGLDIPVENLGDVIVVLERGDDWAVTYPIAEEDDISVFMLEILPDGRRRIDLMPAADTRRLAIVLCPPEVARHRDWAALREQLEEGRLLSITVDVVALRNRSSDAS